MDMMKLTQAVTTRLRCLIHGPEVRERIRLQRLESDAHERLPPGFIIGVYRSGTTLLRYVLDSHSRIAVPPESVFLDPLADLWRSDWVRSGFRGLGVEEQELLRRLRDFSWSLFDDYTRAKNKSRWIDKSPVYVKDLDFLEALFGEQCRYIMLYRHGLDVAQSLTRWYKDSAKLGPAESYRKDRKEPPQLACVRYWAAQCRNMLEFEAAHPEQVIRLRYEDFSTEPERFLPPLFGFLGEEWEPSVLNFHDTSHDFGLQDDKILKSKDFAPRTGTYREWPQEVIDQALGEAEEPLQRLGYL